MRNWFRLLLALLSLMVAGAAQADELRPGYLELTQKDAWEAQIGHLKSWLKGRSGFLLLEFNIPRMGLRADAVLLINGCVVILEFKVGGTITHQLDLNQVWEYALDTKNFHEPSHDLPVIPVLPQGFKGRPSSSKRSTPSKLWNFLPRTLLKSSGLAHPFSLIAELFFKTVGET